MEDFSRKEILVFGNDLNTMSSQGLTSKEMNVLMTVCLIAKDRGIDKVRLPITALRSLADINGMSNKDFCEDMDQFDKKISRLVYKNSVTGKFVRMTIFDWFEASKDELYVEIGISPKATYLFNDLNSNFTKINLKKHNELSLKSSKILYRNLCQYKNTGYWKIDIDEFKRIFGISDNYEVRNIKTKIINPAIKELSDILNITCKVVKNMKTSAHETIGYEFFFNFIPLPECSNKDIINELIPDTRTAKEIGIYETYKKIVKEETEYNITLNEYQINLIANKARELGRSESELRQSLNIIFDMKKVDNFMGVVIDVLTKPEKYAKNISYKKKEKFNNFPQRGDKMTNERKNRYFELLGKLLSDRTLSDSEKIEFEELEKEYNKM